MGALGQVLGVQLGTVVPSPPAYQQLKTLREQLDPFENDESFYVIRLLYQKVRCFPLFSQDYFTHA